MIVQLHTAGALPDEPAVELEVTYVVVLPSVVLRLVYPGGMTETYAAHYWNWYRTIPDDEAYEVEDVEIVTNPS